MFKIRFSKLLIPTLLIATISYFSYVYYLKDVILNNQTRSISINEINQSKELILKKLSNQTEISALEIELTGKTTENITLAFGPSRKEITTQIQLKKGTIDFQKSTEWTSGECYFYLFNETGKAIDLNLDYRFIH